MAHVFDEADQTISEVENHVGGWCDSGHQAPELFRQAGPGSPELPTRFFLVKNRQIEGIFCEPCLIIANHIAKLKKQGLM